MNKSSRENDLLEYQTQELQTMLTEIVQCCDDRKFYEADKFSLPYAELKCILLFKGERYLTVKVLAERLDVAKSRVTKIVEILSGRGLIENMVDPKDARVRLLSLTPAGQKVADQLFVFRQELHRKILLSLSPEERRNVLSSLNTLRSAMEIAKSQLK